MAQSGALAAGAPTVADVAATAASAHASGRRTGLLAAASWVASAASPLLSGCATPPARAPAPDKAPAGLTGQTADSTSALARVTPFSGTAAGEVPAGWHTYAMRRDLKPTRYAVVRDGDRKVLHARAASSATGLRCAVQIDPALFGRLRFSWRVREAPGHADVGVAEHDDCPARLVLAFGGDDTRMPLRDRLFFEQVELFTGQRLPFATLMYVWDGGKHALESVHRNHRTARIQYLTVESSAARAGHWLHYERDVVADYQRVFGEAPGPITGVGVLTDADALKIEMEAWYGDITLSPRLLAPAASAAATG